jgi:hypothetical protein
MARRRLNPTMPVIESPNPFPNTTGQTKKLVASEKHNRTLNFLLGNGEILEIAVNYTGNSSGEKDFHLDGEVLPFLLYACNNVQYVSKKD